MKNFITISLIAWAILAISASSSNAQDSTTGFIMPALNPQSPLAGVKGNHVGIRVPHYKAAIKWYTEKLDFRIVHEWDYADEKLAYLAPANNSDVAPDAGCILSSTKNNKNQFLTRWEVQPIRQ